MNAEEKNVMTIVTIGRIVESSLWYCLKPRDPKGFSYEERMGRYNALVGLTSEGSPFAINCDNNKEAGKALKEDMQYFIEDVYGENGRIVRTDINKNVVVEKSLVIELFSSIVKLRNYLESFFDAAMNALRKENLLGKELEDLIKTDVKYYHCFAGKISCMLIADKFLEINKNANNYAQSYSKSHGGINPHTDPAFHVDDDPSYRLLESEFHQLNQDMVTVLNNYGEDDEDFRYAREQIYSDCEIFTGKKQTSDLQAFFNFFTSYFDKILDQTQNKLNEMFTNMANEMNEPEVVNTNEKDEEKTEILEENNIPSSLEDAIKDA